MIHMVHGQVAGVVTRDNWGKTYEICPHLPMALSKLLAQIQQVIKELVINEKEI